MRRWIAVFVSGAAATGLAVACGSSDSEFGSGENTGDGSADGTTPDPSGFDNDGASATCTPKTCATAGTNCGPVADGCGGLLQCGTCTAPDICGGGGKPSVCAVGNGEGGACVPKTCAAMGINCGPAGDGCGGLIPTCGTCTAPDICGGGGKASVCGGGPDGGGGAVCNLCSKQVKCGGDAGAEAGDGGDGGAVVTTTLTGTVFDPAGLNPLYNAIVYVPDTVPKAFTPGVSCDKCGASVTGNPLVSTTTDAFGKFMLKNVPAGANIPLVIQLGHWRRQVVVPFSINACQTTSLDPPGAPSTWTQAQRNALLTRLPRRQSATANGAAEGDIPLMAISTGGSDPFECLLLKMGIDPLEFTPNTGTGRVHYYTQNGYDLNPSAPTGDKLWTTLANLQKYDIVYLPCEGDPNPSSPTDYGAAARSNIMSYTAQGGRLFTTHYSYAWTQPAWPTVGSWHLDQTYTNSITATIDTSFPKGQAFADWLDNVSATPKAAKGSINLIETRHDIDTVNNPPALRWLWKNPSASGNVNAILHMTFNTPLDAGVDDAGASLACGKVVYSDFHVSASALTGQPHFPASCKTGALTNQEKALEFMVFDLSSCIQNDSAPPWVPPVCTPTTCLKAGAACGPLPDGCGALLDCGPCLNPGDTCGGGGVSNQCGHSNCVPLTCAGVGNACGQMGDGCGNVLTCNCVLPGDWCGGGGVPGICGQPPH